VIQYLGLNASATNKLLSLCTQLVGGLVILYSIDSNIGVINKNTLLSMFAQYFRECPLLKRSVVVEVQGLAMGISRMRGKLSVIRNPKSVEEKLVYLQEQIDGLKREYEEEVKDLRQAFESRSKEMGTHIQETKLKLRDIESKMDEISIGGIKVQVFGVLLMVYGSICGYLD
jgi:hypothetical protein